LSAFLVIPVEDVRPRNRGPSCDAERLTADAIKFLDIYEIHRTQPLNGEVEGTNVAVIARRKCYRKFRTLNSDEGFA
jgi:hypothetical protein